MEPAGKIFTFDGYEVDIDRRTLKFSDDLIKIEPKVFDLLSYFLENNGRVISKEELINSVWGGLAVSDAAISSAVSTLRRSIAQNGFGKRTIKSLYGRGFIFDHASVSFLDRLTDNVEFWRGNRREGRRPIICMLPFRHIGSGNLLASVCRSLEEEVFAGVCRSKAFHVVSKNSIDWHLTDSLETNPALSEMRVDYAIDGSVSLFGKEFRVHVFLIDNKNHSPIWNEVFSGDVSDIFEVEAHIVKKILGAIVPEVYNSEVVLSRRKDPNNWDAYDNVLISLPYCWKLEEGANAVALKHLEAALQLEPSYGLANALKAWCLAQRKIYAWKPQENEAADDLSIEALASKALADDGNDPHVLTVYSTAMTLVGELAAARHAVEKALEIDPNLAWGWNRKGWIEGYDCNADHSIRDFENSLFLSPLDPMRFNCFFGISQGYFIARDFDSALHWVDKALLERPDAIFMHRLRASICFHSGNWEQAKKSAGKLGRNNADIDAQAIGNLVPFSDPAVRKMLVDGLVGAGFN